MKTHKRHHFHQLLAATLAVGSTFQMIAPVLADGTAPGTQIKNSATATFTDGTTNYNATSNEIVITVAEVAGINITAQTPSVTNPNAGDTLFVDYLITNTGNDPTQFFIPGVATLSNTTAFSQNGPIQIVEVNGTALGTPKDVPNAGDNTGNLLGTMGATSGSIPANGTIKVRIPIKVSASAIAGQTLTVALGETSPANGQNQDRTGNAGTKDVYTVDNANGVGGETNSTSPSNGVREAMATSTPITVNARQQAFATVLKALSSYNNNNTPNNLLDDTLLYKLALRVENPTTPPPGLVASDLYGTTINVNNSTATPYVLVSDAIPAGMQLSATNPVGPANWTPVYTTDALTTSPLQAKWTTTRPTSGTITRIGFIYDTTTTPLSKGASGTGNTISGFNFTVTPQAGFTGGQVANIAQVLGQSQPGAVVPGTSTQIVYDESGDQTSNNGLGGNNPDPTTGGASATSGGINNGVANPAVDGTDTGTGNDPTNTSNTNQGNTTNTHGEDSVFNFAATPLNGPYNHPDATGPNDNNDDFTNKSIVVPAGLSPSTNLTDAQTTPTDFNNTIKNTSGGSQDISVIPTPPTTASDLIDNTKVTITDTVTSNSATYIYTAASGFTFSTGTGGTTATKPVKLTVPSGGTANYKVTVDLPDNVPQLKGYPVPITAFVDTNNSGSPTGNPSNITIDRLYTNYLSLVKEARLLEANGTPVTGPAGTFTNNPTDLSAAATPGRIIEYRITYKNISTTGGTNSVILPANSLVIKEDGSAGANTWFSSTTDPKYPTPAIGTATDTPGTGGTAGTISVTVNGTDIQVYTDTVTTVDPGKDGTFTFQRKIK